MSAVGRHGRALRDRRRCLKNSQGSHTWQQNSNQTRSRKRSQRVFTIGSYHQ